MAMKWEDRFTEYFKIGDGCWEWEGAKTGKGYGGFWIKGKTVPAHRISYEFMVGKIPKGLFLDHLCRNRGCVNPLHLEPVTLGENLRRGISRNGIKTHCAKGHPFDETNTRKTSEGRRQCKECVRICCRKRSLKRIEKRCHNCGKIFKTGLYSKAWACSNSCARIMDWRSRKRG